MFKLSYFLTVVLILNSHVVLANTCEELELGATGRDYWTDSIGNGFRGEFENQIQKKDDLFESLLPEFEFDLGAKGKLRSTFTRSVKDYLPIPTNKKISSNDYFTLQVKNKLNIDLSAGFNSDIFFAKASAGIDLTHGTHLFPGKSSSPCEIMKFIDPNTQKGEQLIEGLNAKGECKDRNKSSIVKAYENFIDLLSGGVGWGLDAITDSEKNDVFADDLFAPLKLHSLLGVPINDEIFYENHKDLNIGDIIEHTTYYSITPGGIRLDLFGPVSPSFSKFYRIFRTVTFKKQMKNFVVIEFEDTVLNGENTVIYKISPKIFKILKLNFGQWAFDDYKQEVITNRFRVNLNNNDGQRFFNKVLKSLYLPSIRLSRDDKTLVDASEYLAGVDVMSPAVSDSRGDDNKFEIQLPGLFKYKSGSHSLAENVDFEGNQYTRGNKYHTDSLKSKFAFDLGFLKVHKKYINYDCKMRLSSLVVSKKKPKGSSLNINCKYENRYAQNKHAKGIKEYLKTVVNGELKDEVKAKFEKLNYTERDNISMYSNVSYSDEQIQRILNALEDDIYFAVAKAIFGEKTKNIFAKKYHRNWRRARLGALGPKGERRPSLINSCSLLLKEIGITKRRDLFYDQYQGVVGKNDAIKNVQHYRCYSYFLLARQTADSILELQRSAFSKKRLNNFLEVFESLDKVGFVQSVLSTLAGGVSQGGVHFTYVVDSPFLEEPIVESNGLTYEVEDPKLRMSLSKELQNKFYPRISKVRFTYNSCEENILMAHFKLNYIPENRDDIYVKFTLKNWKMSEDEKIQEYYIPFKNHIFRDSEGVYHARIELDKALNKSSSHNMYTELMNEQNFRLSRELKAYLKKVDTLQERILESRL